MNTIRLVAVAFLIGPFAFATPSMDMVTLKKSPDRDAAKVFAAALKVEKQNVMNLYKVAGKIAGLDQEFIDASSAEDVFKKIVSDPGAAMKFMGVLQLVQDEFIRKNDLENETKLLSLIDQAKAGELLIPLLGLYSATDACSPSAAKLLIDRGAYAKHAPMFGLAQGDEENPSSKTGTLHDVIKARMEIKNTENCQTVAKLLDEASKSGNDILAKMQLKGKPAKERLKKDFAVTDATFKKITASGKVVVLASSDSCAPCSIIAPSFLALSEKYRGCIQFVYYDIDNNSELEVKGVPRRYYFKGGAKVGEASGVETGPKATTVQISEALEKEIVSFLWSPADGVECIQQKLNGKAAGVCPTGNCQQGR